MTDPINDLIIRIKNGYMAGNQTVFSPYSKFREEVLKKLKELGYIANYKVEGERIKEIIIELAYEKDVSALTDVEIFSKPGRRWYVSYKNLKLVSGGLGHSLLSTSKGILTGKEAKKLKIGGELLFNIW